MSNKFSINGRVVTLAPQTATILRHLVAVGELSGVEAIAMYKARSLTKRISEINEAGSRIFYTVESEWKRDKTGQRYKRYHMSDVTRRNVIGLGA